MTWKEKIQTILITLGIATAFFELLIELPSAALLWSLR